MATITDPQINSWWDGEIRPIAEDIERLLIRIRSAKTRYTSEINAKMAAWSDADLLDARDSEGVPISTKAGMVAYATKINALLTAIETSGEGDFVFPAVRSPV